MISSRRVRSGHLFSLGSIPSSEQQELIAKAKAAKVKHHSVGVYKCGDFVSHCVPDFELEEHIAYNTAMRFGRGLFIDGKCVNKGYLSDEEVVAWEAKIKDWSMPEIRYPRS